MLFVITSVSSDCLVIADAFANENIGSILPACHAVGARSLVRVCALLVPWPAKLSPSGKATKVALTK